MFVSFRVFDFPDITADGSITLGAAVAATLLVAQVHPVAGDGDRLPRGSGCGRHDGSDPHAFRHQPAALGHPGDDGALFGQPARHGPEQRATALGADAGDDGGTAGTSLLGAERLHVIGWEVGMRDVSVLMAGAARRVLAGAILFVFFRTHLGTAMQATGDNAQMIRALGVNVNTMIILGLALSNGLVALAGALLAQYQGFADVQMGIGMVVWGLASVIIGEALVGTRQLGFIITGAVMGSVLFRLLVAIALRGGLNPNDLKLITAVFVFAALVLPIVVSKAAGARRGNRPPAGPSAMTSGSCSRSVRFPRRSTPRPPTRCAPSRASTSRSMPGSFVIVVGTNGSGKSTLLNAIAGTFLVDCGLDSDRRRGRHGVARAPPGAVHRTRLPESLQRHGAVDDDCREPRAGDAARAATRPRLGAARPHARRAARSRPLAQHGSRGSARQSDRQPVGRPAPGAHAADGVVGETEAAAARRAHRRPRSEERGSGDSPQPGDRVARPA